MQIRLMEEEKISAYLEFWRRIPGMGLNDYDDSEEGLRRFLRRNPKTAFAVWEGDALLGTILAGHDGRRGFIYHTAVTPTSRGMGIGKSLVTAVMEALRAEGIQKAALVVFRDNGEGNAFWEKLGFTTREDLVYRNRMV